MKLDRMLFALLALFALLLFTGTVSAQRPRGPGRGGPPSFDVLLDAFDANDDGALEEEEVPPPVWRRLSQADAYGDGDGVVTNAEFDGYRKELGGGK